MNRVFGLLLCSSVAVALLAACGGSQPPIGASLDSAAMAAAAKASKGDILYVSGGSVLTPIAYLFSYPKHKRLGTLAGAGPSGLCSDVAGDVFFINYNTSANNSTIYEYAHGGTTPIAMLSDPGAGVGCSVNPINEDLAVANQSDSTNSDHGYGDLAVYSQGKEAPTIYRLSGYGTFFYPGYDNAGNLFATAHTASGGPFLVGLQSGGGALESISVNVELQDNTSLHPSVQWDGTHITVSSESPSGAGGVKVYRLSVSGSTATVVGKTILTTNVNRHRGQSWIAGNKIIGINYDRGDGYVCFWPYPQGGKPQSCSTGIKQDPPGSYLNGVTLSVEL
jgi:hypothetical protein